MANLLLGASRNFMREVDWVMRVIDTTKAFIEQTPIPEISEEEQQPFVALAERIIAGKEQGKDTAALERQIDNLVYKLYDLTYEEVKNRPRLSVERKRI